MTVLSISKGLSVNDFISDEDKTVTYSKFDDALHMVAELGRRILLSKADLQNCLHFSPPS